MEANRILLEKKYARIISRYAERTGVTLEEALRIFYKSETHDIMNEGVTELHCCGVEYLVDELLIEVAYEQERKDRQKDRLKAYEKALRKMLKE